MVPSIVVLGTQKVMAKSGFGRRLYALKYFEVGFFFMFLDHYKLEGNITKICRKTSI
jgi:hypothetical protein